MEKYYRKWVEGDKNKEQSLPSEWSFSFHILTKAFQFWHSSFQAVGLNEQTEVAVLEIVHFVNLSILLSETNIHKKLRSCTW